MSETSLRTHPLIIIAATTVILTCLLAIGIMTGILPSPLAKDRVGLLDNAATPAAKRSALAENSSTPQAPASAPRQRTADTPPVGATGGAGPSQTATGSDAKVAAVCTNCATVTSVRAVKQQGEAGLLGPIAGTAIGGVVGSQIGSGSGRTIATIAGAAGGAALGTEAERRYKSTTHYVVGVRLNDGTTQSFTYGSTPGVQEGDKVRIVDGRLVRDS